MLVYILAINIEREITPNEDVQNGINTIFWYLILLRFNMHANFHGHNENNISHMAQFNFTQSKYLTVDMIKILLTEKKFITSSL